MVCAQASLLSPVSLIKYSDGTRLTTFCFTRLQKMNSIAGAPPHSMNMGQTFSSAQYTAGNAHRFLMQADLCKKLAITQFWWIYSLFAES